MHCFFLKQRLRNLGTIRIDQHLLVFKKPTGSLNTFYHCYEMFPIFIDSFLSVLFFDFLFVYISPPPFISFFLFSLFIFASFFLPFFLVSVNSGNFIFIFFFFCFYLFISVTIFFFPSLKFFIWSSFYSNPLICFLSLRLFSCFFFFSFHLLHFFIPLPCSLTFILTFFSPPQFRSSPSSILLCVVPFFLVGSFSNID